jgi:hypothetical protein
MDTDVSSGLPSEYAAPMELGLPNGPKTTQRPRLRRCMRRSRFRLRTAVKRRRRAITILVPPLALKLRTAVKRRRRAIRGAPSARPICRTDEPGNIKPQRGGMDGQNLPPMAECPNPRLRKATFHEDREKYGGSKTVPIWKTEGTAKRAKYAKPESLRGKGLDFTRISVRQESLVDRANPMR